MPPRRPAPSALWCARIYTYRRILSSVSSSGALLLGNERWYALYVRSRHERAIEQSLLGKGYVAFSPFCRIRRKRSDRTKDVDLPLFPGYVFCRFNATDRLPILTTCGVVTIVGARKLPEAVDEAEILSIHAMVKSGRPIQPWPFLRAGQKVRIQAGPLCGVEGTLLQLKNEYRLVASVGLLQRSVAVEVDRDSVLPLF